MLTNNETYKMTKTLKKFTLYSNPRRKNLSHECPQLNAAPLFGSGDMLQIGFPDVHPLVSMWGHDTYITGFVIIEEGTAVYPGCNFMGDAMFPLIIRKGCSLQHVELHYSGFRQLPTEIGENNFMSHLSFGHSVKTGKNCYILGHTTMYDGAEIGNNVFIEGNSTILGTARLKSGWAYAGVVDRDTPPICRTEEVVFGNDPRTGETLYIGGENGVAGMVNRSHLQRNERQMQLVAMRHGVPECQWPAFAVLKPHVYQTGAHYLSMATLLLNQMPGQSALAHGCADLCQAIRVIYEGADITSQAGSAWTKRTALIEQTTSLLETAQQEYIVTLPSLSPKRVVQSESDLQTMVRKLREFDTGMQQEEQRSAEFYAMQGSLTGQLQVHTGW